MAGWHTDVVHDNTPRQNTPRASSRRYRSSLAVPCIDGHPHVRPAAVRRRRRRPPAETVVRSSGSVCGSAEPGRVRRSFMRAARSSASTCARLSAAQQPARTGRGPGWTWREPDDTVICDPRAAPPLAVLRLRLLALLLRAHGWPQRHFTTCFARPVAVRRRRPPFSRSNGVQSSPVEPTRWPVCLVLW